MCSIVPLGCRGEPTEEMGRAGYSGARQTREQVQVQDTGVWGSDGGFEAWPQNYLTCLPLKGGFSVLSLLEFGLISEGFDQ